MEETFVKVYDESTGGVMHLYFSGLALHAKLNPVRPCFLVGAFADELGVALCTPC